MQWYRLSAEQNYRNAQYRLGYFYQYGYAGLAQDYQKAYYYYDKSAQQGYDFAQNNLGNLYNNGHGVKKDLRLAFYWYQKAAEQGNSAAQYNLAYAYQYGRGTNKNINLALKWYQNSAENGDEDAIYSVGQMYQKEFKSPRKAIEWYKTKAKEGFSVAANSLGVIYQEKENYPNAFHWYTYAAEKSYAKAQYNLANLLYYIKPKKDSLLEAYAWAALAESNDETDATELLKLISKRLSKKEKEEAKLLAIKYQETYSSK